MMRIAVRLLVTVALAGAAAVAIVVFEPQGIFDDDPAVAAVERESSAASVETLAAEFSVEGSFVYNETTTAYAAVAGPDSTSIITAVVEEDAIVDMGSVLWEVNFQPTVLLVGWVPSYRDLARDDIGTDVLQLELNLVALGFDPDQTVTVDETFSYNTKLMVERWQESLGAEVTGEVRHGAVVFAAPDRRVGPVAVTVGDSIVDGQAVLELTGQDRELMFAVDSGDRTTIAVDDTVFARLPDRSEVTATITSLVVTETGGLAATASVEEPPEIAADNLPATVTWSRILAADVLTVPESALLRTDSGAYFVERAGDGVFVEVEPGLSNSGRVEITGEVEAGELLIAP
jgi:peptidoglycan hydrolase-like protein with peptidoglycan-binding domain